MADLQLIEGFDHLVGEGDPGKLVGKGTSTGDGWKGDAITTPETSIDPVTGRDGNGIALQWLAAVTGREMDFELRTDVAAGTGNITRSNGVRPSLKPPGDGGHVAAQQRQKLLYSPG